MNELINRIWKISKEIAIVIMFIISMFIGYGEYTSEKAIKEKDMSIEYTSLKEDNKILLKEIKCIKLELKEVKKDYRLLKLKLYKSNIIDDFGGFVDNKIPKIPKKRVAFDEIILTFEDKMYFLVE